MILFVGDRPSKRMKPGVAPFQGASCERRLAHWIAKLGVGPHRIINSNDVVLLKEYTQRIHVNGCPIIALGNNASKALGSIPHFKLPHPSGRNRLLNDKSYIEKRLNECKIYLKNLG